MVKKDHQQFYGAVTVSARGQIVIPAQARRDLNIEAGEKLLVMGRPGEAGGGGLILVRAEVIGQIVNQWADVIRLLEKQGLAKTTLEEADEEA